MQMNVEMKDYQEEEEEEEENEYYLKFWVFY